MAPRARVCVCVSLVLATAAPPYQGETCATRLFAVLYKRGGDGMKSVEKSTLEFFCTRFSFEPKIASRFDSWVPALR